MVRPLEGIRVLEISTYAFVPSAGAVLAEWGAEVLKVEHPEYGDPMRDMTVSSMPPGTGGFTFMWELLNRGKRGLAIDIATPGGLEIVLQLAETCDVFLTNFLPSTRTKLGIDVDEVMARNPKIVYARGSGHGPRGPEADKGGFDSMSYWYRTGIAAAITPEGTPWPLKMPVPAFGDVQSGTNLAGGIAAGLLHVARRGTGIVVDVSLLGTGMWAMQQTIVAAGLLGTAPARRNPRASLSNPLVNVYRTSDDRFISLNMIAASKYWSGLCATIGALELEHDPRYATDAARTENVDACVAALDEVFSKRTLDEWAEALSGQPGQWGIVKVAGELHQDEQARANGYLQEVDYGDGRSLSLVSAPMQFDESEGELRPAPAHGADTDAVLLELGLSWDRLIELKQEGATI